MTAGALGTDMTKGAPGMPLTAWLLCWGDLGRYEAHYYGLPTLRE